MLGDVPIVNNIQLCFGGLYMNSTKYCLCSERFLLSAGQSKPRALLNQCHDNKNIETVVTM